MAELPLLAGGEAGAAPASQSRLFNSVDNLLGRHFFQDFFQGFKAAGGDVVLDPLRVDATAVAQNNPLLHAVKLDVAVVAHGLAADRVFVEEALDGLAVAEVGGNDFRDVVERDMGVENAFRLDHRHRALLAETVAAGEIDIDLFQAHLRDFIFQGFGNLNRFAGGAASTLANEYGALSAVSWLFFCHLRPPLPSWSTSCRKSRRRWSSWALERRHRYRRPSPGCIPYRG